MKKIFIGCLFVLFYSCEAFFIPDISDETIVALAPLENASLTEGMVTFSWEAIEDAEAYTFQIAKPNFIQANEIVVDTATTETSFKNEITVGAYEWRIKAVNSEHETKYTSHKFVIETDKTVTITAPEDRATLAADAIVFSWEALDDANEYTLQIATPDFDTAIDFLLDDTLSETTFTQELATGNYEWRIKAKSADYETVYTTYTLTIN